MGSGEARLRRSSRVRERKDFVRLSRIGLRRRTPHFVLLVAPRFAGARGGSSEDRRLGITASRKVGNAVQRNRVKRRIREHFRHVRKSLPKGQDVVVIARKGAAQLSSEPFREEIETLFAGVQP